VCFGSHFTGVDVARLFGLLIRYRLPSYQGIAWARLVPA